MIKHTHITIQINIESLSHNLVVKVIAVSWVSVNTGPAVEMSFQIPTVRVCVFLVLQVRKHFT